MNQILEDLLCYPAMYVLHSVMGVSVFFNPQYWNMRPHYLYPTVLMSTMLLGVFVIWSKRTVQWDGRKSIAIILIAPFLYWILAGLIALPVELLWHGLIERRFLATFDYTIGFHPFYAPFSTDLNLVGEKWIEQGPGFYCNPPYEVGARPFSIQIRHGWIIVLWAALAIGVNIVSLRLTDRWSRKIGALLTMHLEPISGSRLKRFRSTLG